MKIVQAKCANRAEVTATKKAIKAITSAKYQRTFRSGGRYIVVFHVKDEG